MAILLVQYPLTGGVPDIMTVAQGHPLWLWAASMLVFGLTSLRSLRFLGEADRYLDYLGFAPATALFALWLVTTPIAISLAVLAALAAVTALIAREGPPLPQTDDAALTSACAHLVATASPGSHVLTVPISSGFEVHYKSGLPCFFPLPLDDSCRDVMLRYPIPLMDLDVMQARFGVTHLVTMTEMEQREPEVAAAVAVLTASFDNGRYRVYTLGTSSRSRSTSATETNHA
jgi:hypothetical protein